jgi:hypothetical protein
MAEKTKHALRAALSALVVISGLVPLVLGTGSSGAQVGWAAGAVAAAGAVNRLLAAADPYLPGWLRVGPPRS